MKKKTTPLMSIVFLIAVCLAFTGPLLHLHNMKQWPIVLAAVCVFTIVLTMQMNNDLISLMAANGYVMGFFISLLFQKSGTDAGGGATSNMWIIWTVVNVGFIIAGFVVTYLQRKKRVTRK